MYKYKTKPYEHQEKIFADSWCRKYFGLFMEMGTGKSKVAIDTMGRLFLEDKIKACLILAPKGVFDNWVMNEIPRHLPSDINVKVVRWQTNHTKTFMSDLEKLILPDMQENNTLQVFVMNVEGLSTTKAFNFAKLFLNKNPDSMMIVDESTTIKNRSAKRTKNVVELGRLALFRRILTGFPVTQSPLDLYSQSEFLSDSMLGYSSFYSFQNRYAQLINRTMGQRQFRQVVGYQNIEELSNKVGDFSYRVLKKDCLDLPSKVYLRREVELTPEQKKVYQEIKKDAISLLENNEIVSVSSVLTQILRLHQVSCGFVKHDEGEEIEIKNKRVDELLDILQELQGKTIIWANYQYDIKRILRVLQDTVGSDLVASYYGETPDEERQPTINEFQNPDSQLQYLVSNVQTGGYGITLTQAKNVIYYSNNYDLEKRLQSEDRAHRIGQENKVTYIDIVAKDTVDEKIVKALRKKLNLAQEVLGDDKWKDWIG